MIAQSGRDDRSACLSGLAELKIPLSEHTIAQLDAYIALLLRWQQAFNLVGSSTIDSIYTRHVLDCAALIPHLKSGEQIADIGSGAGLPAVILVLLSDVAVQAIERNGKRVQFLNTVRRELGLKDRLQVFGDDVKRLAVEKGGSYDVVTARAFADLGEIYKLGLPLLKENGRFCLLKGRNIENELTDFQRNYSVTSEKITRISKKDGEIVVIEK